MSTKSDTKFDNLVHKCTKNIAVAAEQAVLQAAAEVDPRYERFPKGDAQKAAEEKYGPIWHKPIPLGSRVTVFRSNACLGMVSGIASMHCEFRYIVILDEPFEDKYGKHTAVVVSGVELADENGKFIWRCG